VGKTTQIIHDRNGPYFVSPSEQQQQLINPKPQKNGEKNEDKRQNANHVSKKIMLLAMATVVVSDTKVSKDFSSLITIVIVTSPVESNPSTELLDRCLLSIVRAWPELSDCHVVVAADGCQQDESVLDSKRKRVFGKASAAQLRNYHDFLDRLEERSWMTVDRPTAIQNDDDGDDTGLLSTEWLGFALTLQKAIETHVTTPLVFVTPHDYELETEPLKDIRVEQLAQAILCEKSDTNRHAVNYIGLHNAKTLTLSQRNASVLQNLPSIVLQETSTMNSENWMLSPLASWKENPHLASVRAYRDVVFENRIHRFKRGHFIEDTLGQKMLQALKDSDDATITKQQLFESFGTFLLEPPPNEINNKKKQPCTFHINGLRYIGADQRTSRGYAPLKAFEVERAQAAKEFVKMMDAASQKG
jgi:hypothetical protein